MQLSAFCPLSSECSSFFVCVPRFSCTVNDVRISFKNAWISHSCVDAYQCKYSAYNYNYNKCHRTKSYKLNIVMLLLCLVWRLNATAAPAPAMVVRHWLTSAEHGVQCFYSKQTHGLLFSLIICADHSDSVAHSSGFAPGQQRTEKPIF